MMNEIRVSQPSDICIFCLRHKSDERPWCTGNTGRGCTYGFGHEFPEPIVQSSQEHKVVDKKLCTKCGLHPRNPKSASNGCEHEYRS